MLARENLFVVMIVGKGMLAMEGDRSTRERSLGKKQ